MDDSELEGGVWSGWREPTECLSEAVVACLLAPNCDVAGAIALAATNRHWAACVANAEPCWSQAAKERWAVWREAHQAAEPQAIMEWLAGCPSEYADGDALDTEPEEGAPGQSLDTVPGECTWRTVYLVWNRSVQRAVDAALGAADLKAGPCDEKEGSVMYKLWARPMTQDIEFSSWEKALEAMSRARLSPRDVMLHFLASDSALVNFLGVHYLMMEPWAANKGSDLPPTKAHYPKESVPFVRSLLEEYGCADKRIVVRWWELGMLAMGAGWRGNDQMHTVDSSMGPLLRNAGFWRMLLRGVQLEVRRIVVSEE